jgi:hypothetical protein
MDQPSTSRIDVNEYFPRRIIESTCPYALKHFAAINHDVEAAKPWSDTYGNAFMLGNPTTFKCLETSVPILNKNPIFVSVAMKPLFCFG